MFYSKNSGGFYDPVINGSSIPSDAVEITVELHAELLAGQSDGKRIVADAGGFPVLQDSPPMPVVVPDSATAAQIIVWLGKHSNTNGNYLTQVDTYCAGLPRGNPIRTAWEKEPVFYKDAPTFQAIVTLLGFTPQQVDAGLIEANAITF